MWLLNSGLPNSQNIDLRRTKTMDKKKYLNRIQYTGSMEPSLGLLQKLQKQHLLKIPFENLDIINNIPIELSIDRIFEKIVDRRRGGFCYELNGLFYELLVALGFDVKRVSARVYEKTLGYGREFDHMALIVLIDGAEYLSDVGFGEFAFEPLKLEPRKIQKDERGEYMIDSYKNSYMRVAKIENGQVTPEYIFKIDSRLLEDFREMCVYHQTSPESHFTSKRLISLPTEKGRITLSGNCLKITELGSVTESTIKSETAFHSLLQELFFNN